MASFIHHSFIHKHHWYSLVHVLGAVGSLWTKISDFLELML